MGQVAVKKYLKLIPASLRRTTTFRILKNKIKLYRVRIQPCHVTPLASTTQINLDAIFCSEACQEELEVIEKKIAFLAIADKSGGGVNPGDRRAIYHLIRSLKPRSVLEIGTHIGVSTLYIALALKNLRSVEEGDSLHPGDP